MGKKSFNVPGGKENVEDNKEKINEGMINLRKKFRNTCEMKKRSVLGMGGNWKSQWIYDINVLPLELCPLFPQLFMTDTSLSMYVQVLKSTENPDHLFFLVKGLNSLLTNHNPPIGPLIQENTHKLLLELMPTPQLSKDCVGCFINMTSNYACSVFVDDGVIEILFEILETCDDELASLCIWCLGNIAGDCVECRDSIYNKGKFDTILKYTQVSTCKENAAWLLTNLCKGKPSPPAEYLKKACATVLSLLSNDSKTLSYILETILFCNGHLPILSISQVTDILSIVEKDKENSYLALKIIGNLVESSKEYTHMLLEQDILGKILHLVNDGLPKEKKEALLILSNLCVDLDHYLPLFLDHEILKDSLRYLLDKDEELKLEAIWILRNLLKFEDSYEVLHKLGFFHDFLSVFSSHSPSTLIPALESLNFLLPDESFRTLFESNKTLYQISRLVTHTNISIRVLSHQIIQFFSESRIV